MMKKYLWFLFIGCLTKGHAQPTADTARASALFSLSGEWAAKDSAKAVNYALQALRLPLKDGFKKGKAYFYLGKAYFDYDIAKSQQAFLRADTLLQPYTTKDAYLLRSRALSNFGALEQRKSKGGEYLNILLNKVIPLCIKAGDSLSLARNYMNVGLPFMNEKAYDKAIYYFHKAIGILRQVHNTHTLVLSDCYVNAAKASVLSGRVAAAKPLLDSAWAVLENDSPSVYHDYFYVVQGLYFAHSGQLDKAEKALSKGLSMARRLGNREDERMLLYGQFDLYTETHDMPAAKKILLQLYGQRQFLLKNDQQQLLYNLAATEASLGNGKAAYDWLLKYTQLSDSLYIYQTNVEIANLEAKYNYVEKEKEVMALSSKAKIQRLLLWGSIGILLMAMLVFIFLYKQRSLKSKQQLSSLQQHQQIEVTKALMQGEEKERSRLARDLHDGLGSMLAGVKIQLSTIGNGDTPGTLLKAIHQLDDAVTELRRIARNMMPEALLRSGLEVALNDLCQSAATPHTKIELQVMNLSRNIPTQAQIIIYRIVQELLANVLKHAKASEIFVQCSQADELFYITVEDNGQGFILPIAETKKGMGLKNIRNRVDYLQGSMDIVSSPEKGTIINIELHVTAKN